MSATDFTPDEKDSMLAALGEFAIDSHATLSAVRDELPDDHPLRENIQALLDRAEVGPEDGAGGGEPGNVYPGEANQSPEALPSASADEDGWEEVQSIEGTAWRDAIDRLEGDLAELGYARMDNGSVPPGLVGYSLTGGSLVLHTPVTGRERLVFKAAAMEHGLQVQEQGDKGLVAFHPDAPDEAFIEDAAAPLAAESAVLETADIPAGEDAEAIGATGATSSPDGFPALEQALALALGLSRLFLEHNGEPASAEFVNAAIDFIEGLQPHVPADVQEKADVHLAKWDERGWGA